MVYCDSHHMSGGRPGGTMGPSRSGYIGKTWFEQACDVHANPCWMHGFRPGQIQEFKGGGGGGGCRLTQSMYSGGGGGGGGGGARGSCSHPLEVCRILASKCACNHTIRHAP